MDAAKRAKPSNQSQGLGWPSHPDLLPLTGVIVTLNYAGEVVYYRGLIRSDDRDAVREIAQEYDSDNTPMTNLQLPSQQTVKVRPVHSKKLIKQLSANKTGIVAAMLASASRQALALLAAHLGNQIFCHYSQNLHYQNLANAKRLEDERCCTGLRGLQHIDDTSPLDGIAHTVGLDAAAPLQKMKKTDAAKAAEDILAGTGWLPSLLRTAQPISAEH